MIFDNPWSWTECLMLIIDMECPRIGWSDIELWNVGIEGVLQPNFHLFDLLKSFKFQEGSIFCTTSSCRFSMVTEN